MGNPNLAAERERNSVGGCFVENNCFEIDDVSSKNGINSGKLAAAPRPKGACSLDISRRLSRVKS
jgi:hypothetical protein